MIIFDENEISKMIMEKIKDDQKWKDVVFRCHDNYCILADIRLKEATKIYEKLLDGKSIAGVMKKSTNYMDGSHAGYTRDMQLMNGKSTHTHIALYGESINVISKYEDEEKVNLNTDKQAARQMAAEIILPELDNILSVMNMDKNKTENQR